MAETVKTVKGPAKRKTAAPKNVSLEETNPVTVSPEKIAQLAHKLWAERGHQHGHAEEDWFRAEQELRGKAS